jgi:alpha-glucosidase
MQRSWWETAVVYQIYPRSFADSNGDGVGDLPGVTSRLDHLAALGVDAVWLTPFYPSPLADGGYDVADHRDVDPLLGTLDDFDELVREARARGLKVVIDIVPNHTSSRHPWFREALEAGRGSPARERYIFRDGAPDGGPPSDWRSHFGGPAWTRVEDGQWYCHLFDTGQPDLNWGHPQVREDFLATLRFWGDRGVAGFRVDVAHAVAKDLSEPLRSQPDLDRRLPLDGSDPLYDRDEVHEIYRSWRRVFDEYDPPLAAVAETWSPTNRRTRLYGRPSELGQVFDFSLLKSGWDAASYHRVVQEALDDHADGVAEGGGMTWVLSSHDVPRHASRLALPPDADADAWLMSGGKEPSVDPDVGLARARAATLMMLALPGSAYLYQGEEFGLPEVADLPPEALHDPVWERTGRTVKGRDGCRVPLPWTREGVSFGFGDALPWLPQPLAWGALSVEAQEGRPGSTLMLYRSALSVRRERPDLQWTAFGWVEAPPGVLAFERGPRFRCVVNLSEEDVELPAGWRVLLASRDLEGDVLPPDAAVWLAAGP